MDRRTFATALVAGCFAATSEPLFGQAINQEWGNLSATFLYEGEPPIPKVALPVVPLLPGMKLPLMDQSLVVDPATNGIANVAMYLHLPPGDKPAIHPHYRGGQKLVRMDFRD
jgi:hypothetical protein